MFFSLQSLSFYVCVHIGLFSRREDKDSIDFVVVHNNCVCVMHWLYAFLQLGKSISVILTSHIVTVYVYPCAYLRGYPNWKEKTLYNSLVKQT